MAPKKTKFIRKEVLQAVIIGESYDNQFDPITRESSKLLLPLVNTPLLDYNLDWLHRCGVEDVILYCKSTPHSANIDSHCKSLLQRRRWSNMTVRVIASDEFRSMGDMLRDLYARRLVLDDFILMRGDTVASIDLKKMVQVHKLNKRCDSKIALTCLFMPTELPLDPPARKGPPRTFSDSERSLSSLRVSTISDLRGKILKYERHRRGAEFYIPSRLMFGNRDLVTSCQMADPSISICGCDLPGLFADNFDCMTLDGMIKALIQPDDLNECSVFQYVIDQGFATTVATWKDYERASLTVIQRILYPLVPEVSLTSGRHRYIHDSFSHHYWTASGRGGHGQQGDPRAFVRENSGADYGVVCGEATEVSTESEVRSCVLGNLCTVEQRVKLDRVFVGDNCTIKCGCSASQCYLGTNVTLLPNTVLEPGCVVASGLTLGPDQTITKASLLASRKTWAKLDEFERDDTEPVSVSPSAVLFPRTGTTPALEGYTINTDGQTLPIWGLAEDDFIVVDQDEDESSSSGSCSAMAGGEDVTDAPGGDPMEDLDEEEIRELQFHREVVESLVHSIRLDTSPGNVAIEINSSRYAYNINLETMQLIVFRGVLRCYADAEGSGEEYITSSSPWPDWPVVKKGLHRYKEVLSKYMKKDADFLNTLQRLVSQDEDVLALALKILYEMNQELELLDDAYLLYWFKQGGASKDATNPAFGSLKEKVSSFLTWLENAEEESEEDSDED